MAMLFSHPSLCCKVLKAGKSVSRVDELPNEWQAIEGIAIGEQTIQRESYLVSISSILLQSAVGGLQPPLVVGSQVIDPIPGILEWGTMARKRKLHIHLSESGKAL